MRRRGRRSASNFRPLGPDRQGSSRRRCRTLSAVLVGAALLMLRPLVGPAPRAADYKAAPPAAELDARTESWLRGRRTMAALIVGGTLVVGGAASVLRRRARARAARKDAAGGAP